MTQEATQARRTLVRVLFIDRRAADVERMEAELVGAGYQVQGARVESEAALREQLEAQGWDLVLADPLVPGLGAGPALELVKASARHVPFIVVSEVAGEDSAVEALRAGAEDLIYKERLARLGPAVDRALREAVNREEQRRLREQLIVAERMASVGTLAAGVAHEINNPLAAVVANIELALRTLDSLPPEVPEVAELRSELRDAHEAAYLVRQIVRDVKVFSRPGDERPAPVDVRQVMDGAARMAWNEIRHRARLVKDYGDVPPVWTTDARLGQVFLNLLMNAAQAISVGRADSNRIRLCTRTDEGGRAVVEVSDTGTGIAREHLSRIFTPFFSTKPLGSGTGLGLSICQRIVREMGGEIEVTSEVGQGTTVRVNLPAADRVGPAAAARAAP